jgi:hypothetical protein
MSKRKALELLLDGAEVAFKQTVENSLLKDVPIVGSLVKIYEIGASIRDHLYTAKVSKFLLCLDEVPEEDRARLRKSIRYGDGETERLAEKILLVIESQSDIEKSEIIANQFLAYLDSQINSQEFRRALDVTANCFLDDIKQFLEGDGFHGFLRAKFEDLERWGIAGLINSPLIGLDKTSSAELRRDGWGDDSDSVLFESTHFGSCYQKAYHYGRKLRLQHE